MPMPKTAIDKDCYASVQKHKVWMAFNAIVTSPPYNMMSVKILD